MTSSPITDSTWDRQVNNNAFTINFEIELEFQAIIESTEGGKKWGRSNPTAFTIYGVLLLFGMIAGDVTQAIATPNTSECTPCWSEILIF